MKFPVYIDIGSIRIHPHWVFESLAYLVGFQLFLRLRRRSGDALPSAQRLSVVAAAIFGAAVGSKVLFWFSDPGMLLQNWSNPIYLMAGKTIVGALAGGLVAVEWMKKRMGVIQPTGDLFALPLAIGIAVGRVGCFLSGLGDHTYGLPTGLPWGVDFGDGIPRHPTQLYEILWLALLALWIGRLDRAPHRQGDLFKVFMVGYLVFRLWVDFLKPGVPLAGLTALQWVCLAVLLHYRRDLPVLLRGKEAWTHG